MLINFTLPLLLDFGGDHLSDTHIFVVSLTNSGTEGLLRLSFFQDTVTFVSTLSLSRDRRETQTQRLRFTGIPGRRELEGWKRII